jgi:hypothetical protein
MCDFCKSIAIFILLAFVAAVPRLADAQTWSAPQFVANGGGIAVSTNGTGTSAVLFMPPSGGLQASVKTGSTWSTPVTLTSLGSFGAGTGNIAVAPNGDVLAVWSFRTTNTYIPNEAQAAFFTAGHWGSPITISTSVYGNVNSFGLPGIGFDSHSQATVIWELITNQPGDLRIEGADRQCGQRFWLSQNNLECHHLLWPCKIVCELRRASSGG